MRHAEGAFESVDHEQQFEEVAVHGKRAGLNDKDVGTADIFENLKINFTVAEAVELAWPSGTPKCLQIAADSAGLAVPVKNF